MPLDQPVDTAGRGAYPNPRRQAHEGRSPRWYRQLPLAIVALLLLTLVLASLALGHRSDQLRARFADVVMPAHDALLRIQLSLAGELAAIRGYQLTGERLYLARLRAAREGEVDADRRLARLAPLLGPEVERAVATLEARRNTWSEEPERLLRGEITREELSGSLAQGQQRFEAALVAADRVNAAVNRAEDALVHGMGTAAWVERMMVILVSLAALPVVLVVGWLARRLEGATRHLSESETRIRQIAENLREVVWISDPTLTTCYYINPAFERVWRRPLATVYENARTLLEMVHPDDRERVEAAMDGYSKGEFRVRFRIVRPTGEVRWVAVRAAAVRDEHAKIYRIVGTAEDITERKRAEEEREDLLVRERRARAETEAALQTRDRVLRIVSHDLKNPLHTIGMTAELLEMLPSEKRAQQIGILKRTVQRAQQLVFDLLDAARVQSDQPLAVEPEPAETAPLLAEAVEAFNLQAEQKNLRLEQRLAEGAEMVMADQRRVLQVLTNLLGNAVKFTPEGGLIRVEAEPHGPDAVEFSVSDSGPGIAPEVIPNIFEPFTQARDGATLGTGLGLAIAKGIVEAHGGRISVESAPGAGSTFRFTLPRPTA
jgi:PAS domain S-box-containing protein